MKANFQIKGIESNSFLHLFDLTDEELSNIDAKRIVVDEKPGYPCRISLKEANIGETIITIPFKHHDVDSPYKASGPIFVRENVATAKLDTNEIPEILQQRFLSLRVYDDKHMMIDAKTTNGKNIKEVIQDLFLNENAQYIHIHNANPGCYNCRVERVN